MKKARLISILLALMAWVANADLALTVNGLDTTNPVEIEPNALIIISVAGANDTNENYSVVCETGGTLNVLQEPNAVGRNSYVFTFEDLDAGLAAVNLAADSILDYKLVLFTVPDANTVVFGIDGYIRNTGACGGG